ncbi:hypothetical protein ELI30_08740 [Rhizobium leguminosarum]|uniref:hypothetical protein n=1 Tax=Rhizobium leguminosarum TaxID=384 RepID=UPI0010316C5A|nr:hypothetical protein [Rhizobium leguminosarum]TAV48382.1 hypothetical protein ELI32_09195 [Rhizobium leguminosarum]TAV57882.1 hypothetical protein ELI31_08725 [Rhizobium leguminosarum]TAV68822.1 hypothetical protein ELI30_08740 [Rhizobium leguminosarum]
MSESEPEIDTNQLLADAFDWFNEVLEESVRIMTAQEGVDLTGRQRRAVSVFGKTQLHSMTLQTIVEDVVRTGTGLLDHFTVGTITRSVIDASLMTMYLSEPSLTFPQWQLRRELLYLHELTNRKRFLDAQGKVLASDRSGLPFFETYEDDKKDSRGRIALYGEAVGLDRDKITKLQEGQWVFVNGARGAAREAGWDLSAFEFEQAYYSAYVHSHPVSFMKADEQGVSWVHPSPFQENFVALALNVAGMYLERASERMKTFAANESCDPLADHLRNGTWIEEHSFASDDTTVTNAERN